MKNTQNIDKLRKYTKACKQMKQKTKAKQNPQGNFTLQTIALNPFTPLEEHLRI